VQQPSPSGQCCARNSMSCSITSTERSSATASSRRPVFSVSLVSHARHRLVHEQELRILNEHHADLQPLLLPWLRPPARVSACSSSAMVRAWRRRALAEQVGGGRSAWRRHLCSDGRATAPGLAHRQVREDGWSLELSSDPERRDLVLAPADQLGVLAEDDPSRTGSTLPEITSSRVVLPAPFGPITTRSSR